MNGKSNSRAAAALCLGVALLVGAASAAGVFLRGDGTVAEGVSVRGEKFEYATTGVYAYNAVRVVAEGVGWDYVTLFLAVPAMLVVVPLVARGSFRGRLLALGLLSYFFYQYLEYATFWAFGPLFLIFIVIFAASGSGIVMLASGFDLSTTAARFTTSGKRRFPLRGMAILCFSMSAILVAMWLRMILGAMGGATDGVLMGSTTLVVQAYDLGLIVPLMLFTAVSALRKRPIAFLLCPVFAVKAVAMASAICAMLISAWKVEGRFEAVPFVVFGSAATTALVLVVKMFRSVVPESAGEQIGTVDVSLRRG